MKNKSVKVVDQNNIDRDANIMFAIDLDGSEYAVYWIERDDDENNIFVSKVIKNTDGTSNLLNIESDEEKTKVSDIVKTLIAKSVKDENDKLVGDSLTLDDGKAVKFVVVSFNKEQKIDVQRTYITTVKKEVTRVSEKYYDVVVTVEPPKVVEEIFPTISPVVPEVKEESKEIFPEVVTPEVSSVEVAPVPVLEDPTVEFPKVESNDGFVTFGAEPTTVKDEEIPSVVVPEPVVTPQPTVVEPITASIPAADLSKSADTVNTTTSVEPATVLPEPVVAVQKMETPAPVVVDPVVSVTTPVAEVVEPKVVEPIQVVPTPVTPASIAEPTPEVVATPSVEVSQPLVFNASKETNLNAALGEAAKDTTIPVENIEPVREFGVDEPVKTEVSQQPQVTPGVQSAVSSGNKASGFANSKFFMVVAIAFFLASCVFLGYEVFNYFQLTK